MHLIEDRDGEVCVTLVGWPFFRRVSPPTHEIIEEQISEVLGLPGSAKATVLTICHLDKATDVILNFVKSRKWKSIELDFFETVVQDHEASSMRNLIAVSTQQTVSLTVSSCIDTDQSISYSHAIGPVLEEECTNIQTLEFVGCLFVRREEAIALASGLSSNKTLRKLVFSYCKFEEESLQLLAASLTHRLEQIVLFLADDDDDDDDSDHGENLISAFISSIPLKFCPRTLRIDYHCSDHDLLLEGPLVALGNLLAQKDCDLEDLTLWMGDPQDCNAHSFEHFAEGLRTNHSLGKLMLGNLQLSDELAESLAGAFQQYSTLREVDIRSAKLTDRGFSCLGQALLAMPGLKVARIMDPSLTTETADKLDLARC